MLWELIQATLLGKGRATREVCIVRNCRTDGATVLDTAKYLCKLNTREAGTKILKRKDGTFEKQYRQNLGKLVIAYRWTVPCVYGRLL